MVEETDMELWQNMFATHVMGPVALTKALLPADAGGGRGPHRAWCPARAGYAGMPGIAPYSAAKGALERWGESMAGEIAPFGIGVTILVDGHVRHRHHHRRGHHRRPDFDGPYARLHNTMNTRGRFAMQFCPTAGAVRRRSGQGAGRQRRRSAVTASGPDASMLLVVQQDSCRPRGCITCPGWSWASPGRGRCGAAPTR